MNQTPHNSSTNETVLPTEYANLRRPKPTWSLEWPWAFILTGLGLLTILLTDFPQRDWSAPFIEYKALTHEVKSTYATVTQLVKNGSGKTINCEVNYNFKVPNNNDSLTYIHKTEETSCNYYSSLKVGQNIQILYATSHPNMSVIDRADAPSAKTTIISMVIIFILSLLAISRGLNILHLRKKLQQEGKKTKAIIFDRWEENSDPRMYYIAYAFKTSTLRGNRVVTRADDNVDAYHKYQVGDTITVCYLPEDPQKVCRVIKNS